MLNVVAEMRFQEVLNGGEEDREQRKRGVFCVWDVELKKQKDKNGWWKYEITDKYFEFDKLSI